MRNAKNNFLSQKFTHVTSQTKLLFLAVLVSVMWFSLAYLFSNSNENYIGTETLNSRVAELVEVSGDGEPPPQIDAYIDDARLSIALIFLAAFVIRLSQFKQLRSNAAFLYSIGARAPPRHLSRS